MDARDWVIDADGNCRPDNESSWRDLNFTVEMSDFGDVPLGEYEIYLKINDPKEQSSNKRCIQFANKGEMWNALIGANRIATLVVR